jgi:hypothetical protein
MAASEQPKIIVDSDWKQQAQAEKERLAAKEQASRPAPATAGGAGGDMEGEEGLPGADFSALVGTILTPALHYLGAFPDPQTGRAVVSLEYAKLYIDLLAVLEEKTKGNLTAEESKDLTQALTELRSRFVEISRAVASHVAKERTGQGGGGMGGVGGVGGMGGGGGLGGLGGEFRIAP